MSYTSVPDMYVYASKCMIIYKFPMSMSYRLISRVYICILWLACFYSYVSFLF